MDFVDFLYDEKKIKKKFKVNILKITKSVWIYIKFILEYRKRGFGRATNLINNYYGKNRRTIEKNLVCHSYVDFQRVASRLIPLYRFWGEFVKQSDLCLERSMALACALISAGIPANLVIGKAKYYINENFSFHAWVEVGGQPLNDHDGMHKQWTIIYKLPKLNISNI